MPQQGRSAFEGAQGGGKHKMIAIIDNYDSFTYNLFQYIGMISPDVEVFRNDNVGVTELEGMKPSHVVISPGPGLPDNAGISCEAVKALGRKIPVLGVCLGHQAIGQAYGGSIIHAGKPVHGKSWEISLDTECPIFSGLNERIDGGRYHSLIVERNSLPEELIITARTDGGEIMGLRHRELPVYGIQFHPESVLTGCGMKILENFIAIKGRN